MENRKYNMHQISIMAALLMLLILSAGCAKVETPVFDPGKSLTIIVEYRDNINTALNKYYILFNNNAAPNVTFMPIEFIEPGDAINQPEVDYYGIYYPTWKEYIVLDGNTFYFVKGPYTSEAVPSKEVLAIWNGNETKRITLNIALNKLAPTTDRLHFDVVSVDKATKLVKDNLSRLNSSNSSNYIFTIADSTASGSDEGTEGIRENMDIINWRMLIQ